MNSDQPRTPALATFLDSVHVLALAAWLSCLVAAGVAAMGVFSTLPTVDLVLPRFADYVEATTPPDARAREFGRIAGGLVMEPIFRHTDLAQAIAGGLALVTLGAQLVAFPRRWPLTLAACGESHAACNRAHSRMAASPSLAVDSLEYSVATAPNLIMGPAEADSISATQHFRHRLQVATWLRLLCVVAAALLVAWHAAVVVPRMNESLFAWWSAAAANDPVAATFRAAFDDDHHRADLLFRVRLVLVVAALALSVCRATVPPRAA